MLYNIDAVRHLDTRSVSLVSLIFYLLFQSSYLLSNQIITVIVIIILRLWYKCILPVF